MPRRLLDAQRDARGIAAAWALILPAIAFGLALRPVPATADDVAHPSDIPPAPAVPAYPPAVDPSPSRPAEPSSPRATSSSVSVPAVSSAPPVRKPLGPDELPDVLPGRWKVSLCVLTPPGHAWIRYENVDTGEVRSASRFHLLVGGWFDEKQHHWNYGPTVKTGVYMDREQHIEHKYARDTYLLLSAFVENPKIYKGDHNGRGHGVAVNNCVTYTRDAWYFHTGEYYELKGIHSPADFRSTVLAHHPEVRALRPANPPSPR